MNTLAKTKSNKPNEKKTLNKTNPWAISLWVSFVILFTLTGCKKKSDNIHTKDAFLLDTYISISIYDTGSTNTDIDKILNNCIAKIETYESLFSRTIETSEVSQINNSDGKPIKVSDDTFELINKGVYYGDISDGLFDITIAKATELWDFHDNKSSHSIPEKQALGEAVSHISYKNIILNDTNKTVTLTDKAAAIDLGGLAKGYIADKIKEYLISENITSALINLGGNILTIGSKPQNKPFKVGIKKPFSPGEIITDVSLVNNGVATSGIYERYFKINDKIYHHILNPRTGYPVDTDLYSVSVVCDSSIDSDAIGTICILLGKEKASEFAKQFPDARFIFVDSDYSIYEIQ